MNIKENFHKLIDTIEDEETLKGYYTLIQSLSSKQSGKLWEGLSKDEKEELLVSYEESYDGSNIISHDEVMKQHEKWLKR